ncbi:hypothetical protein [Janthinobacterium sp. Ant5-2-1]|uniref:hypothetical protein n=1 Tax=Janthinobacterium sp. Ant5-2-1 TaxID=1755239 RepID=UPI00071807E9|nr:hypothetical protein [Janthinobacterium sp. Ant5-2-1]
MQSSVCRVYVNQVEVGALPEQDYRSPVAEAQREVKNERRLYLAQAFNLIGCSYRVAKLTVFLLPLQLFFSVVAGLLFAPSMMAELLEAMRHASATEVIAAMRTLVQIWVIITIFLLFTVAMFSGNWFGYINQFTKAVGERISLRIRAILEVAADGVVEVNIGKSCRR